MAGKTVLIGWELGAGTGHVARLLPIIRRYIENGWKVVAALREVAKFDPFLADLVTSRIQPSVQICQAPIFRHSRRPLSPFTSLAGVFREIGFAEMDKLRPVIDAWSQLVRLVEPSLIVTDSAPSLQVAVAGRLPTIAIGNGWSIPPNSALLLDGSPEAYLDAARADEARVLDAVARSSKGAYLPSVFAEILRGTANFVSTLAELDPYRNQRVDPLYWPVEIMRPPADRTGERDGGLCYLPRKHPAQALVKCASEASETFLNAYFGGDDVGRHPRMDVRETPLDFAVEMRTRKFAIHHGGLGVATWCLAYRVPQLICCVDVEKHMVACGVALAGAGGSFPLSASSVTLARAMTEVSLISPLAPSDCELETDNPNSTLECLIEISEQLLA